MSTKAENLLMLIVLISGAFLLASIVDGGGQEPVDKPRPAVVRSPEPQKILPAITLHKRVDKHHTVR